MPAEAPAALSVMKAATRRLSAQPTGYASRPRDLRDHGAAYGCSWRRPDGYALLSRVTAERNGPDVPADERLPFGALAEADLQPTKRRRTFLAREHSQGVTSSAAWRSSQRRPAAALRQRLKANGGKTRRAWFRRSRKRGPRDQWRTPAARALTEGGAGRTATVPGPRDERTLGRAGADNRHRWGCFSDSPIDSCAGSCRASA